MKSRAHIVALPIFNVLSGFEGAFVPIGGLAITTRVVASGQDLGHLMHTLYEQPGRAQQAHVVWASPAHVTAHRLSSDRRVPLSSRKT